MKAKRKTRRDESRTRLESEARKDNTAGGRGNLSRLDNGDLDDWNVVSRMTGTPMPGIARAVAVGNLHFVNVGICRFCVLSDSSRRLARSWSMDGAPMGRLPDEGMCQRGGGWGIGLDRAAFASRIILTFDADDFLRQHARAAREGHADWCVTSTLGASKAFSQAALGAFRGKTVEIPPDTGDALIRQLRNAGCRIETREGSATTAKP